MKNFYDQPVEDSTPVRLARTTDIFHDYSDRVFHENYGLESLSDVRSIRESLSELEKQGTLPIDDWEWLRLTVSEIVSNLLSHPPKRPDNVTLSIFLNKTADKAMIDIADNSAPFYEFQKRKQNSVNIIESGQLDSQGRGLALIDKMYPDHLYIPCTKSVDSLNHFIFWSPSRDEGESVLTQNDVDVSRGVESLEKILMRSGVNFQTQKKVFVVDDDRVTRLLLEKMLDPYYQVYVFDHAQEALNQFSSIKPDMIISDIAMPDMDGIQLRRALSNEKEGDTTPFVFLSATDKKKVQRYVNQLGIDDYLEKPINKEALLNVTQRLLSRSSQVRNKINGIIGQDITAVLQPELPNQVLGWRTAVKTLSADTGGGDFLLHQETDQGASIVLSDVMGHGLEAKFFAYAFAGYFRSLFRFLKEKQNPEIVLEKFSQAVNEDPLLTNTMVTCLAIWLNAEGEITLASAAHPRPYIVSKEECAWPVDIAGPLPGLIGTSAYNPFSYCLAPNERIFFFTDGLIEKKGDLEATQKNEDALLKKVIETIGFDIDEASYQVWDYYQHHIRPYQDMADDATFVLVEYDNQKGEKNHDE